MGGATDWKLTLVYNVKISIHAPRGGSDSAIVDLPPHNGHFNPRSPWGERLVGAIDKFNEELFQSTLPVGGATLAQLFLVRLVFISIHAPRGGSDETNGGYVAIHMIFQSTLPVGGATVIKAIEEYENGISIHAPRGGSDRNFVGQLG